MTEHWPALPAALTTPDAVTAALIAGCALGGLALLALAVLLWRTRQRPDPQAALMAELTRAQADAQNQHRSAATIHALKNAPPIVTPACPAGERRVGHRPGMRGDRLSEAASCFELSFCHRLPDREGAVGKPKAPGGVAAITSPRPNRVEAADG